MSSARQCLAKANHAVWSAVPEFWKRRLVEPTCHACRYAKTPGWRLWLRLDLAAALAARHSFHLAANGVLLTEGLLPLEYVSQVDVNDVHWGD